MLLSISKIVKFRKHFFVEKFIWFLKTEFLWNIELVIKPLFPISLNTIGWMHLKAHSGSKVSNDSTNSFKKIVFQKLIFLLKFMVNFFTRDRPKWVFKIVAFLTIFIIFKWNSYKLVITCNYIKKRILLIILNDLINTRNLSSKKCKL